MSIYENKLGGGFRADRPNQKWVTDISYIHTGEGTLFLYAIKDLYDNFIVAYDMGTVQDNALVHRVIQKPKKEVAGELIFYSGQGGQYISPSYFDLIKQYGMLLSMSRTTTHLGMLPLKTSSVF